MTLESPETFEAAESEIDDLIDPRWSERTADAMRTMVRPTISYVSIGLLAYVAIQWGHESGDFEAVFERVALITGPILGFWFGERKARNGDS